MDRSRYVIGLASSFVHVSCEVDVINLVEESGKGKTTAAWRKKTENWQELFKSTYHRAAYFQGHYISIAHQIYHDTIIITICNSSPM